MSTHIYNDRARESGNVIWFIMLAIALTAALTMTLTRGSDSGGQTGDVERARVQASEIMRYASGLERAIDQMILRGVGQSELSFENNFASGYQNARCPNPGDACRVFGPGGGAQAYMKPRREWLDMAQDTRPLYEEWYITGHVCVEDVGSGGAGCESDGNGAHEDLVLFLPWVKEDICRQINIILGRAGDPPVEVGAWPSANTKFQGTYADGEILNQPGLASGCIAGSGGNTPPGGTFAYYHVLIAR